MKCSGMKILLMGPYPPPHGGVSVHVARTRYLLEDLGVCCRVLNPDRNAPPQGGTLKISGGFSFLLILFRHVRRGWILHLHTNGHNERSWLIALLCGLLGKFGAGSLLTLHSGMVPEYLSRSLRRRLQARATCRLYNRLICVNPAIGQSIARLGCPGQLEILPAFMPDAPPKTDIPEEVQGWISEHDPVLCTTLFFRPEYGFELLLQALGRLRKSYPRLGCLVMGSGEPPRQTKALICKQELQDAVRLLGDVPHHLCLSLMSLSHLYVRPSVADGDAVSVREAIGLGIPVVASRVGHRPPQAILFEPGDARDMAKKIEAVLARPRPAPSPDAGSEKEGQRLLEKYQRLSHPNGAPEARCSRVKSSLFRGLYYLRRMGEMSRKERSYRLLNKFRREAERVSLILRRGEESTLLPEQGSWKEYLQRTFDDRFYVRGTGRHRKRLVDWMGRNHPGWRERAVEEAGQVCRHRIDLLGHRKIQLDQEINWHRDPRTGAVWPLRFWADYDPVRDCSCGDVKTIYELNRHQYLPRLAKAYFLTGEERYAREALAQLESWIEQNPPGLGINWNSSLEIALRSISWVWTIFFLLESACFTDRMAQRIVASLFAQWQHVFRYPSRFSSPNTHLIAEAAGLFLAGLLFADLQTDPWREAGAGLLVQEADRQILPDGVHAELSTYYHCYALDLYLQALLLGRRNGFEFPAALWEKTRRMLTFVMHATRPDGSLPQLGDDDGGRALALCDQTYQSFQDVLCTGAVLFQRPDFKHQAGDFREQSFWLLGESGWETYRSLPAAPPPATAAGFPQAGYFIQRSGWESGDSQLIFDCGGLGMLSGGHAHADALSFTLFTRGKELLVDPGTFTYNGSAQWRNFFRSTRAHNTVAIDRRDQSAPAGTFRWKGEIGCQAGLQFSGGRIEYLEGEHNAYAGPGAGIVHRRRVLFIKPDYWFILDDFRGWGKHCFEFYYHFAPGVKLIPVAGNHPDSQVALRADAGKAAAELCVLAAAPLNFEVICARRRPPQGWVSPCYGRKSPAPVLRLELEGEVPTLVAAALIPFAPVESLPASRVPASGFRFQSLGLESAGVLGCQVEGADFSDVLLFSQGRDRFAWRNYQAQGEVFWLRQRGGELEKLFAVRARHFSHLATPLLESPQPLACACLELAQAPCSPQMAKVG